MDEQVERTSVTFLGRFGPYDTTTSGGLAGLSFEGGISRDELRSALIEAEVLPLGGYAIKQETREFNWGGYSLVEDFLVEIPQSIDEEVFWALVGYVIDRIRRKIKGTPSVPNETSGAQSAVGYILVAFPDESRESLTVIGDGVDTERATRQITVSSPAWEYRVDVRSTPSGFPFVVAHQRTSRAVG